MRNSQGLTLLLEVSLPTLVESFLSTPVSPLEAASLVLHLPSTSGQPKFLHPSLQVIITMARIVIAPIF